MADPVEVDFQADVSERRVLVLAFAAPGRPVYTQGAPKNTLKEEGRPAWAEAAQQRAVWARLPTCYWSATSKCPQISFRQNQ
jgi:hypothetical protein